MSRRFVLLDRDGTINVHRHHLSRVEHMELLPGAASGLRTLRGLGLGLVVITNQSVIGRGILDEAGLAAINRRLADLLAAEGVALDGIYHCPHTPDEGCACRKPGTALAERAAAQHGFEPGAGYMIGDSVCDIEMGARLGATTILVRTGLGAGYPGPDIAPVRPDHVVDDLAGAARLIARLEAARTPETHARSLTA
ncbi:MAG: HAD family hydrolase [Anaerolineae bacterium]|nr:HAD family hydrolase [Anaerolineae bacterium]